MKRPRGLNKRIKAAPACANCVQTAGLWRNDSPGERCDCPRGQLLAVADRNRARREQREREVHLADSTLTEGGKAA